MSLLTTGRRIHSREVRGTSENGLSSTRRRALDKLLYAFGALSLSFAMVTTSFPSTANFLHELQSSRDVVKGGIAPMLARMNGPQRASLPSRGQVETDSCSSPFGR